jgi:hypothetical protein
MSEFSDANPTDAPGTATGAATGAATGTATGAATGTATGTATGGVQGADVFSASRNALVRLFYALSRKGSASQTAHLLSDFRSIVKSLFFSPRPRGEPIDDWNRGALIALVLQTRDLAGGKGEYGLFYLLMGELFMCDYTNNGPRSVTASARSEEKAESCNFTTLLLSIMESLVGPVDVNATTEEQPLQRSSRPYRPYGSWKDFRSVLTHVREMVGEEVLVQTEFFKGCISMMLRQLKSDHANMESNPNAPISLFAKWAPREKNHKHGWLAKHVAQNISSDDDSQVESRTSTPAQLARYRRWVSALNRHLRTPEIAQCEGRWRDIDFRRDVPAGTMRRQRHAFQYPSWSDTEPMPATPRAQDRGECRRNYLEYLRDCAQGTSVMKAGNLSPRALVQDAIEVTESGTYTAREAAVAASAINLQWWEGRMQVPQNTLIHPHPIIPIIDTSCTMSMDSDDPLCAAIGIGIRLADTSKLGRRLITFGPSPVWINLDKEDTLTAAVSEIRAASSAGGNADILAAFELVANACAEANMHPNVGRGLCIVLLSDADDGTWRPPAPLHERTVDLFRDAGLRSKHACAYPTPHIVYWALRTMQPLPCSTTTAGVSLVSGYSPTVELGLRAGGVSFLGDIAPNPENAMTRALTRKGRYAWAWDMAKKVDRPMDQGGWIW